MEFTIKKSSQAFMWVGVIVGFGIGLYLLNALGFTKEPFYLAFIGFFIGVGCISLAAIFKGKSYKIIVDDAYLQIKDRKIKWEDIRKLIVEVTTHEKMFVTVNKIEVLKFKSDAGTDKIVNTHRIENYDKLKSFVLSKIPKELVEDKDYEMSH